MACTLYRLDFADGKSYIGMTSKRLEERHAHHVRAAERGTKPPLYAAWRRHGPPRLVPLAIVEDKEKNATERRAIRVFCTTYPYGYNVKPGGHYTSGHLGKPHSPEARAKMSEACRKRPLASEETRRKLSVAHRGRVHTEQARKNMSAAQKNRIITEEHRRKIGESLRGHKWTPEQRARLSLIRKGHTTSPETRAKISAAHTGKKLAPERVAKMRLYRATEETRKKLSEAHKGKKQSPEQIAKRVKSIRRTRARKFGLV